MSGQHSRVTCPWPISTLLLLLVSACSDDIVVCPGDKTNEQQFPNDPPIITEQPDTSAVVDEPLELRVLAFDPNGDDLTYSFSMDNPSESYSPDASIDPETGIWKFNPQSEDIPFVDVTFTATEGPGNNVSTQFRVWVVEYHWDQENVQADAYSFWFGNSFSLGPLGQEFIPTASFLDVIRLVIKDSTGGNSPGRLTLNIRADTITSPVLGTSDTLSFAPLFKGEATFLFDRIVLTPGLRYVIEVVPLSDPGYMVGGDYDAYALGRAITSGTPSANLDLWFRTGWKSP